MALELLAQLIVLDAIDRRGFDVRHVDRDLVVHELVVADLLDVRRDFAVQNVVGADLVALFFWVGPETAPLALY